LGVARSVKQGLFLMLMQFALFSFTPRLQLDEFELNLT
jgi:hypothetical protein